MATNKVSTHLVDREKDVDYIYLDSKRKPTSGIGHLLSKSEEEEYGVDAWALKNIPAIGKRWVGVDKDNNIIRIKPEIIQGWFANDSTEATKHATNQARKLKISDPDFIDALVSVNFQLGAGWKNDFNDAWDALKEGKYSTAIENIEWIDPKNKQKGHSKWWGDSKNRAMDFQNAIRIYQSSQDTSVLIEDWTKEDNIYK